MRGSRLVLSRELPHPLDAEAAETTSAVCLSVQRERIYMPYASNDALPPRIREYLPPHAQDIFRKAFNNAWVTYGDGDPARQEEIAHRVAWGAVKKRYRKVGSEWLPEAGEPE